MADGFVSVSRHIEAPATRLFALLADTANHSLIDGSGMVREPVVAGTLSGTGDTFRMNMHHDEWGDYQMHNEVVEFQAGERIVWQPARVEVIGPEQQEVLRSAFYRWGFEFVADGPDATLVTETFDCTRSPDELREAVREGEGWRDAITSSLAKLDQLAKAVAPR
jgi:Polyketide cyclase / dehydrase and lipid transport